MGGIFELQEDRKEDGGQNLGWVLKEKIYSLFLQKGELTTVTMTVLSPEVMVNTPGVLISHQIE